MSADEIRARTQAVWDQFYSLRRIWARSRCTVSFRSRVAFVLISKLYTADVREHGDRDR